MVDIYPDLKIPRCVHSKRFQRYFDSINKKYFKGELPKVGVYVAPLLKLPGHSYQEVEEWRKGGRWIDGGVYGLAGWTKTEYPVILLDKGTSVFHIQMTKITVIHEAIHWKIGLDKGHGREFKKEIRRIAALGAFDSLI